MGAYYMYVHGRLQQKPEIAGWALARYFIHPWRKGFYSPLAERVLLTRDGHSNDHWGCRIIHHHIALA